MTLLIEYETSFSQNHASGRLSRLPPLTLRPTSASLRARGARDEHGATSWSRGMDFNTGRRISYSNTNTKGGTQSQFLGATTASGTRLGLSELATVR